jgi:hypothetical protein
MRPDAASSNQLHAPKMTARRLMTVMLATARCARAQQNPQATTE